MGYTPPINLFPDWSMQETETEGIFVLESPDDPSVYVIAQSNEERDGYLYWHPNDDESLSLLATVREDVPNTPIHKALYIQVNGKIGGVTIKPDGVREFRRGGELIDEKKFFQLLHKDKSPLSSLVPELDKVAKEALARAAPPKDEPPIAAPGYSPHQITHWENSNGLKVTEHTTLTATGESAPLYQLTLPSAEAPQEITAQAAQCLIQQMQETDRKAVTIAHDTTAIHHGMRGKVNTAVCRPVR